MEKKTRSRLIVILIITIIIVLGVSMFFNLYEVYHNAMFVNQGTKELKADIFAAENKKTAKNGIVFFGDSITEMYDVNRYFPDLKIINRGISGDTTLGMLKRLDSNLLSIQPKTVRFLGGANDLGHERTPDDVIITIREILTTIQQTLPDCKIIVESIYPVNADHIGIYGFNFVGERKNESVRLLNSYIEALCEELNITFVNTYELLVDNGVLNESYSIDGLHVNAEAYEIISNKLKPFLV